MGALLATIGVDPANFPYMKFTLAAFITNCIFEYYVDLRQRSQLQKEKMPEVLKSLNYTEEKFLQNNAYALDKMDFSLVRSAYGLVKESALLLLFFYPLMWNQTLPILNLLGLDASYKLTQQIIYMLMESLFGTVIGIPWSLYYDFVLEQKWGFNNKTLKLFVTDLFKSFGINLLISVPLMCVILRTIEWAGPLWYVYIWAILSAFMLAMMWIYPEFIQPCFDKVEPLPEGEVREAIEKLADGLDYPLKGLYQIDGSKRSAHSNAYLYGFCNNKRIVIFDTLLKQMNTQELVAVLGHELGHWSHNHTVTQLITTEIQLFVSFFLIGFVIEDKKMYTEFGFDDKILYVGLSLAMNLFTPLAIPMKFATNAWIRSMEFQADEFAVNLNKGKDLRSGLLKLSEENKSAMDPDPLYSTLNYSHPPMIDRINAIDKLMEKRK